MTAKALMIQGTGSSVGKSVLVAALCRIFRRRGLRVAPFKSQNMSLNSFVTREGHEIGRAQAVQAEAAGLEPSSLMNPVLLKPCSDRKSQVIVRGKVRRTLDAREYYAFRHSLREEVRDAFAALSAAHDLVLIEGAGSPAEINLRENDIANMGMAEMADAPVLLVGDIDRGGVFASLYGTVKLLAKGEQARVKGLIINKFRGDESILGPGLRQLEGLLDLPVLGVLPYWDIAIDEEDSLTPRLGPKGPAENGQAGSGGAKASGESAAPLPGPASPALDIVVLRLPRMSNFTDFAVFDSLPDVILRYAKTPEQIGTPDLLILPGSKSTAADLLHLERLGMAGAVRRLHRQGTPVMGVCGGFQMLGRFIHDSLRVESDRETVAGLGLLEMETRFSPEKSTEQTRLRIGEAPGLLARARGMELAGYEIHMGHSFATGNIVPLEADAPSKGQTPLRAAANPEGTVFGAYLHGIFDHPPFTRALLNALRMKKGLAPLDCENPDHTARRGAEYDRLADVVEAHLDMAAVLRIAGIRL